MTSAPGAATIAARASTIAATPRWLTALVSNFSAETTADRSSINNSPTECGASAIATIIGPHEPVHQTPLRIPSRTDALSALQPSGGNDRKRWQARRHSRFQRVDSHAAATANDPEITNGPVAFGPINQTADSRRTPTADHTAR